MKLSEGATAARDVACGMRSSLLLLHPAHPFFPPASSRCRRKSPVCFRGGALRDNVSSSVRRYYPTCPSLYLRCVRRASSKSPTITRDSLGDGERANIRFSWLPTSSSSPRFYLIFYGNLPFVPLSIFLRCLPLRELFNRLCFLFFASTCSFFFFFFSTSLRTKARRACHDGKQLSGVAVLIPHDDLIPLRMTICFEPRI